ncbi:N-formylglutamate amidohydrolase [Acetobacteraceae bacterium]|nr:N-formylglutamate amidohydrolase [Acetobacteraceae bacterium]
MRRASAFNIRLGESPFFFVSDHAGKLFPESLGNLGLAQKDQERHIAYDLGIREVGSVLADRLKATLVEQNFSRLVIDCNRQPERKDIIPEISDGTIIPANLNLSKKERAWRHKKIFQPYHQKISELLEERISQKKPTFFVSLHSFTPKLKTDAFKRPWEIGLLFNHDAESASIFKEILFRKNDSLCIGENKPYSLDLEKEYTVPTHAGNRKISALEIEIRQDFLQSEKSFIFITELLYQSFIMMQKMLWR